LLKRLIVFLFGPIEKPQAQAILESEISFLRDQNKLLLETIKGFQAPKPVTYGPEAFKPRKFDANSKSFIPKTDEEINQDMQGLKELGIL